MAELHGSTFDWYTKVKDVLPDWELLDPLAMDQADLLDLLCKSSAELQVPWLNLLLSISSSSNRITRSSPLRVVSLSFCDLETV